MGALLALAQANPAGHNVQLVALTSAYRPVAHATGAPLVVAHMEPAGQAVHTPTPSSEYEPVAQAWGAEDTLRHAEPAGQTVQAVALPTLYVPCVQATCCQGSGQLLPGGHAEHTPAPAALCWPTPHSVGAAVVFPHE